MPSIIVDITAQAKPDCDQQGCKQQAQFQMFMRGPKGEYEGNKFYFCRSDAPNAWTKFLLPMAEQFMKTLKQHIVCVVEDLDKVRERAAHEARKTKSTSPLILIPKFRR